MLSVTEGTPASSELYCRQCNCAQADSAHDMQLANLIIFVLEGLCHAGGAVTGNSCWLALSICTGAH